MEEERIRQVLRAQAWERAKAELRSMLVTCYDENTTYEGLSKAIKDFVLHVEDNGLNE